MSFDIDTLRTMVAQHGPVARVLVAEVRGSAPREVGAWMVVWATGQSGTIGGGALEYDAAAKARVLGPDRAVQVPLGPALGQCCGGAVTLLTEWWDQARLDTVNGPLVARGPGDKPLAVKRLLAQARAGTPVAAQYVQGWMVEPIAPRRRPLWIYGAGHVGRALVDVMHPLPDFAITWVDTDANRFPEVPDGVTQLIAMHPADVVCHAPRDAEHLILTYSHALDLELCHRVLSHGFAWIGLIGSATKWARFQSRLVQLGHANAQIARICCPIGRPSDGKHPQAIAISVASALLTQAKESQTAKERA